MTDERKETGYFNEWEEKWRLKFADRQSNVFSHRQDAKRPAPPEVHELVINDDLVREIYEADDINGKRYVSMDEAKRMERVAKAKGEREAARNWIIPAVVTAAAYMLGAVMQWWLP